MIQLSNEYKRNLLFTNTNKALLEIVKNATPEQLTQLKETKDVKSFMTSLFQEKLTGNKSDQLLLEMLKSAPQFKTMGNFTTNLKTLIHDLKSSPTLPTAALEKFLQNSSNIDSKTIQTQMKNSGIFMESKIAEFIQQTSQSLPRPNIQEIKNDLSSLFSKLISTPFPESDKLLDGIEKLLNSFTTTTTKELKAIIQTFKEIPLPHELAPDAAKIIPKLTLLLKSKEPAMDHSLPPILADDLKSSLLTLSKTLDGSDAPHAAKQLEQIDKLLLQIDYYQLHSHLSASSSFYFPFEWNQLEEGFVRFKRKDEKKSYCNVHLKFKEYGELTLMMSLFDEHHLEIHFHTEKPSLNSLLKEHLNELKQLLSKSGFILKSIRVHEENEPERQLQGTYTNDSSESYGGFEVKA